MLGLVTVCRAAWPRPGPGPGREPRAGPRPCQAGRPPVLGPGSVGPGTGPGVGHPQKTGGGPSPGPARGEGVKQGDETASERGRPPASRRLLPPRPARFPGSRCQGLGLPPHRISARRRRGRHRDWCSRAARVSAGGTGRSCTWSGARQAGVPTVYSQRPAATARRACSVAGRGLAPERGSSALNVCGGRIGKTTRSREGGG